MRSYIVEFGVLIIIEGTGIHPAARLIALARYDEIDWEAMEEKNPWWHYEFYDGTSNRVEGSEMRRSKLRRGGDSLGVQFLPSMEVVWKSDKFFSWEVASYCAVDHP